jgi:hypothetical protein
VVVHVVVDLGRVVKYWQLLVLEKERSCYREEEGRRKICVFGIGQKLVASKREGRKGCFKSYNTSKRPTRLIVKMLAPSTRPSGPRRRSSGYVDVDVRKFTRTIQQVSEP